MQAAPKCRPTGVWTLTLGLIALIGPPARSIAAQPPVYGPTYADLHGEMLLLPAGQGFSIYSLAALLPLLPAKQRITDPQDWMSTDAEVACPDPNCPTRFRITRTGRRYFRRLCSVQSLFLPSGDGP